MAQRAPRAQGACRVGAKRARPQRSPCGMAAPASAGSPGFGARPRNVAERVSRRTVQPPCRGGCVVRMQNVCENRVIPSEKTEETVTNGTPCSWPTVRAAECAIIDGEASRKRGSPAGSARWHRPQRTEGRPVKGAGEVLDQFFSQISFVDIFNFCVFLTFSICYTYQLYYVFVVLTRKPQELVAKQQPPVRRRRVGAQRERRHRRPHPLHQGAELPAGAHRRVRDRRQLHRRHGRGRPRGRRHRVPPLERRRRWGRATRSTTASRSSASSTPTAATRPISCSTPTTCWT